LTAATLMDRSRKVIVLMDDESVGGGSHNRRTFRTGMRERHFLLRAHIADATNHSAAGAWQIYPQPRNTCLHGIQ